MPEANNTDSNNPPPQGNGAAGQPGNSGNSNPAGNAGDSGAAGHGGSGSAPPQVSAGAGHGGNGAPSFGEVLTAVHALPERLVSALREAVPASQPSRTPPPTTDTGDTGNGVQNGTQTASRGTAAERPREPGRKSFAQWWFGS